MILKRLFTYLGIGLLITSCFEFKEPKKPKDLISKEKMVNVLIDAKLLGSANMAKKRIMENHGVKLESYLFEKYNIDSLQFALSNEYYTFHIEEYKDIYEIVTDSLERLKVYYQDLEQKEIEREKAKRRQDSLQMLTGLKDSISNLKLHDSIKTRLQKEVLLDTTLLNDKLKKIIKENELLLEESPVKKLTAVTAPEPLN